MNDKKGQLEIVKEQYDISQEDLDSLHPNFREYVLYLESKSEHDEAKIKRLQKEVAFDEMTGLQRRGNFERKVLNYIDHLKADADKGYHSGMGFVFIDTRDFKKINDSLGDPGGDAVLKGIAKELKAKTRHYDEISRWGGDEFASLVKARGVGKYHAIGNLYSATASLPLRMGNLYIDGPEIPEGLRVELDMGATAMDSKMVADELKSKNANDILAEIHKKSSRASKISKYEAKEHEDKRFMCFWNPGYPTGEISSQILRASETPVYLSDLRDGGEEFIICAWEKRI